jgi:hypothetical protein
MTPMRHKKYGTIGELLEIIVKGIQYRIREWQRKQKDIKK